MTSDKKETFVALVYGPSGLGKTTDCGFSFPNAYFLAAPGALKSIESMCGYSPPGANIKTIPEAIKVLQIFGKEGKYKTLVIDDFSFMAEQTFSWLEAKKMTGFKLWGEMRDLAIEFRNESRYSGMNVVLNCWEQPPKVTPEGAKIRGGPMLPGKLPEQIPALCDIVLRAMPDSKRQPHPVVYRCMPDPSYSMKDRNSIADRVDPAPMNIGEILRAGGEDLGPRRWPEQEDQVEKFSQLFTGVVAEDKEKANQTFRALRSAGMSIHQTRWTIRDALDRALIRRDLNTSNEDFFKVTNELE
jgi:hypothetical protein